MLLFNLPLNINYFFGFIEKPYYLMITFFAFFHLILLFAPKHFGTSNIFFSLVYSSILVNLIFYVFGVDFALNYSGEEKKAPLDSNWDILVYLLCILGIIGVLVLIGNMPPETLEKMRTSSGAYYDYGDGEFRFDIDLMLYAMEERTYED